jgi:hypothetical protein
MLAKQLLLVPYPYLIEIFPDEWTEATWNGRYFLIETPTGVESVAYEDVLDVELDYNKRKAHDPVNNPSHYTSHPSGVECIQVVEHMNFCLGNAMKYIWRTGLKSDDPIQDLEKAIFYINREIERIKNAKP